MGDGTAEGISGTLRMTNQTNTALKTKFFGRWVTYMNTDSVSVTQWGGYRNTATDTDAIRFFFSSGNITSGNYRVYCEM